MIRDEKIKLIIKNNHKLFRQFIKRKMFEIFDINFIEKDISLSKIRYGTDIYDFIELDINNEICKLLISDYSSFLMHINPDKFDEISDSIDYEDINYIDMECDDYLSANYQMQFDMRPFFRMVKLQILLSE